MAKFRLTTIFPNGEIEQLEQDRAYKGAAFFRETNEKRILKSFDEQVSDSTFIHTKTTEAGTYTLVHQRIEAPKRKKEEKSENLKNFLKLVSKEKPISKSNWIERARQRKLKRTVLNYTNYKLEQALSIQKWNEARHNKGTNREQFCIDCYCDYLKICAAELYESNIERTRQLRKEVCSYHLETGFATFDEGRDEHTVKNINDLMDDLTS